MDFINTIMEFFRVFVAWVLALFTTTPPVITPPVITTDFSTGVAKMDLSPGIAKMDLSPGIAKMDLSPGIAKMDLSPGIAKMDLSPGIAKMDLSPGIAKMDLSAGLATMDLSPGIAKMDLSAGLATMSLPAFKPVLTPTLSTISSTILPKPIPPNAKPLPQNSLVLINNGREYTIKGKFQNQDVTLYDDLRYAKGLNEQYAVNQIVLFRFTDPVSKQEYFLHLKITKSFVVFEKDAFFSMMAKHFTAQIVEGYENSFIGIH